MRGARARRHRPQHLVDVGRIDVVVDHDHVLAEIRACGALRGERHHLRCVPGVLLLDRDDRDAPARSFGDRPHALDARDAELLQIGPDARGAQRCPEEARLVRGAIGHQRAGERRVRAVAQLLHAHERRRAARAAVVAGEFAEGAFGERFIGIDVPFEDDLRVGRQRQPGEIALEELDRLPGDARVVVVLALGLRQARRGDEKEQGIDAVARRDRHRLAHLPPLLPVDGRVLAGRGVDADLARALDHHAIGADVDAAALRILRDHRVPGAEILAAVERPHTLRGEHADVDSVAHHDVLVGDGALGRHFHRRHFPAELLLQDLHRLERMVHRLLADHQAEAREVAADHVVERLVAGMALHVLEEQHRALLTAHEIRERRRLEIRVDLRADALELAEPFHLLEPQIEAALRAALSLHLCMHDRAPYSSVIFACRITWLHFAASRLTYAANSSGEPLIGSK